MIKTIIISGCCGFIGSYITRACLQKGWYVKGIDKLTYASDKYLLDEFYQNPNFSFVRCDINDLEFLYDCDYFINTCAETHVGNSIVNSDEFIKSNINGVHHLLELIKDHRGENSEKPIFMQFSTDEVYGDLEGNGAHLETDILKPSNPYSASKAAADMLVLAWARTYNLPYIIVRPTNNYGIGQYVEKLIPKTCKCLRLGKKIPLHNSGTPIRNWLHAQDTADAIITIIESGVKNEIYNIAGGFEQSNIDVVENIVKEYYKDEINWNFGHLLNYTDLSYSRKGQDIRYALDDSKLRSLGWSPKANFDMELVQIVEHYKNSKFIW